MALNYIWIGLFLIGILFGVVKLVFFGDTSTLPTMMDSTFKMSTEAFEMTLGLTGTLAFWMGMMKVAEDSGLVQRLAKFLSPVLTKLFPDIPENHPALGSIFMNYSANMLGLDNAATPIGLKAMQELQTLNTNKDTASNSMIMFLVLNTSGLTIIPVSIMAYRSSNGAADPTDVFIPMLLATMFSSVVGLLAVSVRQRINLFSKAILLAILAVGVLVAGLFSIRGTGILPCDDIVHHIGCDSLLYHLWHEEEDECILFVYRWCQRWFSGSCQHHSILCGNIGGSRYLQRVGSLDACNEWT